MIGSLFTMAAVSTGLVSLVKKQERVSLAAAPYMKFIRISAAEHEISEGILIGILWQESRFNPAAVGGAGEIGMAQFKRIAAEDVNMNLDDLTDPANAIEAAARLLALNRKRFKGSMWDSIRAYNVGSGTAMQNDNAGQSYAFDVMVTSGGRTLAQMLGLI